MAVVTTRTSFGDGASGRPPAGRLRSLWPAAVALTAAVAVATVMIAQSLLAFAVAYAVALGLTIGAGVVFFRRSRGAGNWRP